MTELKLGNDPVGVASSHEFDFHADDKMRSGNNPFHPSDDANRPQNKLDL
jgi:hypothetical protein